MSNVTVTVGHTVDFTLRFLDQHGNPMLTTPTLDSPPVWTDTNSATGTLSAAPSGLTAQEIAVAPGADIVSVEVMAGGIKFSASLDVTVQAEPQVLTSVEIVATAV